MEGKDDDMANLPQITQKTDPTLCLALTEMCQISSSNSQSFPPMSLACDPVGYTNVSRVMQPGQAK